jgi:cytochrome c-type biogenesis protein CcmE
VTRTRQGSDSGSGTSTATEDDGSGAHTGSVPDLFKRGRHIVVEGTLRSGVFVAEPGSMITKCPSKYAPTSGDSSA